MGGFPALMIKPPESPVQQLGQVQQVVSGQQQMQMQALQIQQQQQAITDQHALTQAMKNYDPNNLDKLPMDVIKAGGSGTAAMNLSKMLLSVRQTSSEIAKNDAITALDNADAKIKTNDAYRGRLLSIAGITDPAQKQSAWDAEITKEEQAGTVKPGQISHTYPGDDKTIATANQYAAGSQLQKEAQERQNISQNAWKPAGGALTNVMTGETIGGLTNIPLMNKALETRWQVYHPGEPLPAQFTLAPNAPPADFERVDKLLQSTEEASRQKMTHADAEKQLAVSNAIRQQMYEANIDRQGLKPVVGTDPKTGRTVAVPYSQAQQLGIKDAAEMPGTEYAKTLSGRNWLQLALAQAPKDAPSSDMGISQLLNKMDTAGKLGPLAGRWNDFMTAGWGSGDPDYAALKTKMDLSSTLLGSVHTGRLGPFLLENLQSLAQTKKMDGPTLKSAFNTEIRYVQDRAMDPNPPDYSQPKGTPTAKSAPANGAAVKAPTAASHPFFDKFGGTTNQ